jgi:hypothetical protein
MIQSIQEYDKKHVVKPSQFVIKFDRPESLLNPIGKFYDALYNLRDKIGVTKLQEELETFCYGWALENNYSLEIDRVKKIYSFTHNSILN